MRTDPQHNQELKSQPPGDAVAARIERVIRSEFELPASLPVRTTDPLDMWVHDELDRTELVLDLEEAFGCVIPDDEIDRIETVGGLIVYLEDRVKRGTAR
jgi:acyl carrier protein